MNEQDRIIRPDQPLSQQAEGAAPDKSWGDKENPAFEIPDELQKYVPQVQSFIDNYKELFWTIARDRTLNFRPANGFFIDYKTGDVGLDVNDWKWAEENNLSEWQIIWSMCHELEHFFDLRENPKETLGNFEYTERKAKELAPRVLEIWKKKLGGALPDYLTEEIDVGDGKKMTFAEAFLCKTLNGPLYNSLNDIYVNRTIPQRAATFSGSKAPEVERLYRDYLFPTNPKKISEPPKELEAADYENLPKSYQLTYYLLRRFMVPGQGVLISDIVTEKLKGFADEIAEEEGITLQNEIIKRITNPAFSKSKDPGWRYRQIKQLIEPVFIELLMQDLEELPPPKLIIVKGKGKGKGEEKGEKDKDKDQQDEPSESKEDKEGDGDPWKPLNQKPEHIDMEKIKDFIKQQKEKDKEEGKQKKEEERIARLTPEEKAREAKAKDDARICKEFNIDPHLAEEYREMEQSVSPYKKELSEVFEKLMNTIARQTTTFWMENFKSGRFDMERFIRKYGPELAMERPDLIPWEELDTYDQKEFISKLVLFPEKLKILLVLDGSGSMDGDRLLALKQLTVLLLEGLSTFEKTINIRFKLKKPLIVDTEIHMFGDSDNSLIVKTPSQGKVSYEQELADRFKAMEMINNSYGWTCDAEPFWNINNNITPQEEKDLKSGKAKYLIFEVTDGGSNQPSKYAHGASGPQDTRNAVRAVEKKGAIARGLQVATDSAEDKKTFKEIWGEDGRYTPHPKDLTPAVSEMLAEEINKIQFRIQYLEEEEE